MMRIWHVASGRQLLQCQFQEEPTKVIFSGTKSQIVIANAEGVWLWDSADSQTPRLLVTGDVSSIAYSPNRKYFGVVERNGTARVWEHKTMKLVLNLKGKTRLLFGKRYVIAFSSDSKIVAIPDDNHDIRLWDVVRGKIIGRLKGHTQDIIGIVFGQGGKTVWTASSDGCVQMWDLQKYRSKRQLPIHKNGCWAIALSPNSEALATTDGDGNIRLWSCSSGKFLRRMHGPESGINELTFSPNGRTLAGSGEPVKLRFWDTNSGKECKNDVGHYGAVTSICISANGRLIASASTDRTARLWDLSTGKLMHTLRGHKKQVASVEILSDRNHFVTCSDDRTIRIWTATSAKPKLVFHAHDNQRISSLAACADNKTLASYGSDGMIRFWEMPTGKYIYGMRVSSAARLCASPTASHIAYSLADRVTAWDVQNRYRSFCVKGLRATRAITYSPDGRILAVGQDDGWSVVQLYEAATGDCMETVQLRTRKSPNAIAYIHHGTKIACGMVDGSLLVHDLIAGKVISRFETHCGGISDLASTPDGQLLVSGHFNSTVQIWNIPKIEKNQRRLSATLKENQLNKTWDKLGKNAVFAFGYMKTLIRHPEQAISLLSSKLCPIPTPNNDVIASHVRRLSDDRFRVRSTATTELEKFGDLAVPALRARLVKAHTIDERSRIQELLQLASKWSPDELRVLRSIQVLEFIGSPEAKTIIRRLAKGSPASRLTMQAKSSLDRLRSKIK